MKQNKAFTSIQFLITLFALSTLIIASGLILKSQKLFVQKQLTLNETHQKIDECITALAGILSTEKSPENNTQQDTFWKLNGTEINGCTISISSLSSKLDVNFLPSWIYTETDVNKLFLTTNSPIMMELQKQREGLFYRYDSLSKFISEDNFNKYFTTYGWANFNISDNVGIQYLISHLFNQAEANNFILKRENVLSNNQLMHSYVEYQLFCGVNFKDILNYITLSPLLNVNFMDEEILSSILSHHSFDIPNARYKAAQIVTEASLSGITKEKLISILGVPKNNMIYYYLGTITWFWEIVIQSDNTKCTLIIARYPETDDFSTDTKWFILEKRWE